MTAKFTFPPFLTQVALRGFVEAKRSGPLLFWQAAPVVVWAAVSVLLGLIVGVAAVALPPTGAFGIVAVVGLILLWVTPDLPVAPMRAVRKACFAVLVVDICVPFYYTVQVSGLPWISVRRIAAFALIAPFLFGVAASSAVRRRVLARARAAWPIVICALGFLTTIFLSVLTSWQPPTSLSQAVDAILEWYVPFFAVICIINDYSDILRILKVVCLCAIFIAVGGMVEFHAQHNIFLGLLPKSMLDQFLAQNPAFARGLENLFRNGMYRASSIFAVSNSFGEFEMIILPIGLFFLLNGRSLSVRTLGLTTAVTAIVGLVCSGARAGYMAMIPSMAVFALIWGVRKARASPISLAPSFVAIAAGLGFVLVIAAILFVPRVRVLVLGDGMASYSTQSRFDQWNAGWPYIKSNPITGHGYALGGDIIGGDTVDSYPLSLLVETGVPSLVFFMGLSLLPIWYNIRSSLIARSENGALSGALACSFIAFAVTRTVLSVRENHMFFFLLVAITIVIAYFDATESLPKDAANQGIAARARDALGRDFQFERSSPRGSSLSDRAGNASSTRT